LRNDIDNSLTKLGFAARTQCGHRDADLSEQ